MAIQVLKPRKAYRDGIGNTSDALRRCIGHAVVSVEVSDDATMRRFVFDDGSRFILYSNGAFAWNGPPAPVEPAARAGAQEPCGSCGLPILDGQETATVCPGTSPSYRVHRRCGKVGTAHGRVVPASPGVEPAAPPEGPQQDELPSPAHSFDARLWAESFVARVARHPGIPTDEGTMLGWFASALMRGFDEAHHRRDVQDREFIGWLSVEIPELHGVEVPRLADAYKRFLNTRDPDSAESRAALSASRTAPPAVCGAASQEPTP